MEWKLNSSSPIYQQLVEQMTLRIATGVYLPGQRLPPVRELAMEAGVNPNTMQRALGELERQGLMASQRTSGRFVTEDADVIQQAKEKLAKGYMETFFTSMAGLGFEQQDILLLIQRRREEENHDTHIGSKRTI